jgi:hypothetical protein
MVAHSRGRPSNPQLTPPPKLIPTLAELATILVRSPLGFRLLTLNRADSGIVALAALTERMGAVDWTSRIALLAVRPVGGGGG